MEVSIKKRENMPNAIAAQGLDPEELDLLFEEQGDRMTKLISDLCFDHYAIAPIMNRMRMRPSLDVPTAAVDGYGRGIFNPFFTRDLTKSQLTFLLLHESFHVLLEANLRFKLIAKEDGFENDMATFGYRHHLFNIAQDALINENLISAGYTALENMITYENIEKQTGMTRECFDEADSEEIYYELLKKQSEANQMPMTCTSMPDNQGSNSSSSNSSSGSSGQPEDDDSGKDNSGQGNQQDQNQESGDGKDQNAIDGKNKSGNANGCGNSGDSEDSEESAPDFTDDMNYDGVINDVYGPATSFDTSTFGADANELDRVNDSMMPEILESLSIDWRSILERFVLNVSGRGSTHKTWRRPNKYYREIYPVTKGRLRDQKKDIIFTIDASGSMDEGKIARLVSLIADFQKKFALGTKYAFFNTSHSEIYKMTTMEDFRRHFFEFAGGGTDIRAALHGGRITDEAAAVILISDMDFGIQPNYVARSLDDLHTPYYVIGVGCDYSKSYTNILGKDKFVAI